MGRGKLTPKDEALKPLIASNIKNLLSSRGEKAADLQRATKIAQSTISDYISGKTLVNPGNLEKIAGHFGVLKSEIDPRFSNDIDTNMGQEVFYSNTLAKISEVSSKLEEPRQQIVLETAQAQYDEQESSKIIDIRLTQDWLYEQVSHAVADDGIPLTEEQKQFYMKLLKKTMQERIDRGE